MGGENSQLRWFSKCEVASFQPQPATKRWVHEGRAVVVSPLHAQGESYGDNFGKSRLVDNPMFTGNASPCVFFSSWMGGRDWIGVQGRLIITRNQEPITAHPSPSKVQDQVSSFTAMGPDSIEFFPHFIYIIYSKNWHGK